MPWRGAKAFSTVTGEQADSTVSIAIPNQACAIPAS
jgi:hypothetical protein